MKTESKIAAFRAKPATIIATVLLIGSFVAAVVLLVLINQGKTNDQRYLQQASDLRAQAYRLTSLARDATSGDEQAFGELTGVVSSMSGTWDMLRTSDERTRKALSVEFDKFGAIWKGVQNNAQDIATNKDLIVSLNNVGNTLNDNLPTLQTEHNNIVDILLESGAPADQAIQAQLLSWRAERIGRNVDKMLRGDADAGNAADQFNRDANFYARVLSAMKEGDPALRITRVSDPQARASLDQITLLFDGVSKSIQEMVDGSATLTRARQAADALLVDTPQLLQSLAAISDKIAQQADNRPFVNNTWVIVFAAITLISLFFLGFNQYRGARKRADETTETNERNQTAILRLLDELADLADGDLTTTATVTEDFTGAIADSINFTIDQLRILVARINETAVNVSAAAQETQQTALHLAEASEHQAQEIAGASAAVNEMAVTIDQVSANAAESAAVAERAVSIAGNGAKVVQNTIHGMDTIREQIQDTSKRIKRLGESSQEIGDIVSLINDIADQTNILALNAAIQASMAGDAGRGFAVVADEVQRLAERSAAATKQIEALVKTIQNDTNEAVISMEQTTSEVVRGARLAQDAGVALEEIENVSSSLAELIQNISNAARQQASSAGHISNTMNVIQEITTQTSAGTSATAQSIGNLAEMALDLRESVAGFKLPEEDMSEGRANAARKAMATTPAMDFDQNADVIDLDEELLPDDDIFANASKA
ncbi:MULTISPECIES: methyl-accepting chemotaxis protein [unclassified Cellvibrio]|jgi:twitching motility protein PilJ|uniref:methyl-accepting chemotaxis protein n=1 Tax=unclassified Cellvibrio TaxID=2624793 RepID=UPI0002FCCD2C|nr:MULTISPECIES: methyl-accepting chemotaxis protein [unclassified Cellvibrio]QEY11418.1 methyl-accepting chemotaxis protein [Cellvibrio sp. KY-YJ-3]UUA71539.1 methyl-accepting chemotaxis protein [Cellvibrio sp. QJXJ]